MRAWNLLVRRIEAVLLQHRVEIHRAFASEIGGAGAGPIKLDPTGFDRFQLLFVFRVDRPWPGAEHADVAEDTGIIVGDGDCMAAAYGEAGNGSIIFIGDHPIVRVSAVRTGPACPARSTGTGAIKPSRIKTCTVC